MDLRRIVNMVNTINELDNGQLFLELVKLTNNENGCKFLYILKNFGKIHTRLARQLIPSLSNLEMLFNKRNFEGEQDEKYIVFSQLFQNKNICKNTGNMIIYEFKPKYNMLFDTLELYHLSIETRNEIDELIKQSEAYLIDNFVSKKHIDKRKQIVKENSIDFTKTTNHLHIAFTSGKGYDDYYDALPNKESIEIRAYKLIIDSFENKMEILDLDSDKVIEYLQTKYVEGQLLDMEKIPKNDRNEIFRD